MTDQEMIEMGGYLLFSWASGYGLGLMLYAVRKFAEKI